MADLIIGASLKSFRYSNMAMKRLVDYGREVKAIGLKEGEVYGVSIQKGQPVFEDIHTVLMYINPTRQPEYYDYIVGLNPKRIIFNPGTENDEFIQMAKEKNIEPVIACSLVMMSVGNF
jgi:predicted CoA-binding protein